MNKYKLSVIIPVYNVEEYIAKCLDSVLPQIDDSMEVICVNDGSPDNSRAIISEYMDRYPQLKCVDRENGGLSAARNTGTKAAKGEYVLYVDSDDWLEENVLEQMYNKAKSHDVDVLFGNVRWIYPDREKLEKQTTGAVVSKPVTGQQAMEAFMTAEIYVPMAYNSLCKRNFLVENELWFKEGLIYEDELWTPQILMKAKRVLGSDIIHYYYLQRDNAITSSSGSQKKIDSFFYVSQQLRNMSENTDTDSLKDLLWFRASVIYYRGFKMCQSLNPKQKPSYKITWKDLKKAKLSDEMFEKSLGFLNYNLRERRLIRLIKKYF